MSATVLGMGIVAPGAAADCTALLDALEGPPPRPARVGMVSDDPEARLRRIPRLERMALAATRQALSTTVPRNGSLALVYGTGYGGLSATVDFLEGLASRGPAYGSPNAFHQSVHHSAAGQLSIALGIRGPSLTVSARELSGETALQVGLELLTTGRAQRVLVVAADERVPALDAGYRAFGMLASDEAATSRHSLEPGEGAAALLLGKEPGPLRIEQCTLTAHPTPVLRFARTDQFAPLLRQGLAMRAARQWFSLAAPNDELLEAERSVLGDRVQPSSCWTDARHFGFHPSAGLLRIVAAAVRLRAEPDAACVLHSLALGGGQALTVMCHASR